jgi:integrase/recombinase XerD
MVIPPVAGEVRVVNGLVLPAFGEVVAMTSVTLPWRLASLPVPGDGEIVDEFLKDLTASDCSPATIRSYAYDLLRWWRFLNALRVRWDTAQRLDVRDFVLWMRQARDGSGFAPATIDHNLSVLSVFYDFLGARGEGPVMNPVPPTTADPRQHPHHNPMEPYQRHRRALYRQRIPEIEPRALADDTVERLFIALRSNRDRALVSMYLASGVRASELLGMRGRDVDWGRSMIAVTSKGTRAYQWVPTSPDALTWLRLYLSEGFDALPAESLWWTLREPRRPLQYTAVRAVLRRVESELGAHVTVHDFRRTCATRLANDPDVPLTDVQAVLRHVQITTTARYVRPTTDDVIRRFQDHQQHRPKPAGAPAWQYQSSDLDELFGGTR